MGRISPIIAMTKQTFNFQKKPNLNPVIYAYSLPNDISKKGQLKIGYTTKTAKERIKEQIGATRSKFDILLEESAMRNDGTSFDDHTIHKYLRENKVTNTEGEWFTCSVGTVKAAILSVKSRDFTGNGNRSLDFKMRPEQQEAVDKTIRYFKSIKKESTKRIPRFLWNAKMRFGKTFATYQLAKKMKWSKILVLTFKPAVQNAWEEDLQNHRDFKDWQFVSKNSLQFEKGNFKQPFVCFGSFQDYLGKNSVGGIKQKNEWVHTTHWDCVVLDEYHYGAWRENAKDLFEAEDQKEIDFMQGKGLNDFNEDLMPITTSYYLYLSGTPFRAIQSGEFIEEQIFNWTYSDEQKAKTNWKAKNNPYLSLPRMVMLTYQLPETIKKIAMEGEFNEFDLNVFFKAKDLNDTNDAEKHEFVYEDYVQKWLNFIRDSYSPNIKTALKLKTKKPILPFSDVRLLDLLSHTFWFLPSVNSCYAMRNLLAKKQNKFYSDYKIIVAAGNQAGIGVEALLPINKAMANPLKSKTITLSCGKLTTGVSVKPWSGIFMLRNTTSPETYFQAAFRVQTPWTIKNIDGKSPNEEEIIKKECYVFDFAPNRALRQIADYSCRLNINEVNREKQVEEFIQFLPILAYDGSSMKQIDPAGVLDMAMSGTTATLLAKRWESALLVNVDNFTLERLMKNSKALESLMKIEGFRNLNQDIETIINKSEKIHKMKQEANTKDLTSKQKKELTEEEKEYQNLRKQIQEKLIKFATRIPVFMYLTDYREQTLKDVITQLEPKLFKKVTGLSIKDFELLVSLNLFNSALMNDAVYNFKRYEDASLSYTGIEKKRLDGIGLYDTVI